MKRASPFDIVVSQQLAIKPHRGEHEEGRRLPPRVRINTVTHDHDGKSGLPRTLCGIRWIPNVMVPQAFPRGIPTEDEVDCMTCLVLEART